MQRESGTYNFMKKTIYSFFYILGSLFYYLFSKGRIYLWRTLIYKSIIKCDEKNNVKIKTSKIIKSRITVKGFNNSVSICGYIHCCNITIEGNNNNIEILNDDKINNTKIYLRGEKNLIKIGWRSATNGSVMICMGINNSLVIGNHCMIADQTDFWATDSHPIYIDGHISNPSLSINIKNHVWIGKRASILKGVTIGNNSIVGFGSIVTKNVPDNTLVAGNPARIIKDKVNWEKKHINC